MEFKRGHIPGTINAPVRKILLNRSQIVCSDKTWPNEFIVTKERIEMKETQDAEKGCAGRVAKLKQTFISGGKYER